MKKEKKAGIKHKMIILVIGIVILIGLIIYNQYKTAKDREEYQQIIEIKKQEKAEKKKEEKEPEDKTEEKKDDEGKQDQTITITNLQEIATPVMGNYDKNLEVRLYEYVMEQNLSAESAKILQVVVPEYEPQTTEFYTKVDDKNHSIVRLVWHSKERVVTASECTLSEEEIETLAWGDNGPKVRDITPEEEEQLSREQEVTDGSEGEN